MAGNVTTTAEALRVLAEAMRSAGVAHASFRHGPVEALTLGLPPVGALDLPEVQTPGLTPEELQQREEQMLFASSEGP